MDVRILVYDFVPWVKDCLCLCFYASLSLLLANSVLHTWGFSWIRNGPEHVTFFWPMECSKSPLIWRQQLVKKRWPEWPTTWDIFPRSMRTEPYLFKLCLTWGERFPDQHRVALRGWRRIFISLGWVSHLPIRICVYCESWMRESELGTPEYYSCISLELFMLSCLHLLPPVLPPARSSPPHRSAVWYCWSMRALASLRRCCMLAPRASNLSCLNVVGTHKMSRSHLFSGPSILAKPYPLTMKAQSDRQNMQSFPKWMFFSI